MIPTTPKGTRTWRSSSPLASVEPRTTSPTGSGRPATSRSPWAMPATRAVVEPEPVDHVRRRARRPRRPARRRRWPRGPRPRRRRGRRPSPAARRPWSRGWRAASSVAAVRARRATAPNAPVSAVWCGHGQACGQRIERPTPLASAVRAAAQARCAGTAGRRATFFSTTSSPTTSQRGRSADSRCSFHTPQRQGGGVEHRLALVPELDLRASQPVDARSRGTVLLAEPLHGARTISGSTGSPASVNVTCQ